MLTQKLYRNSMVIVIGLTAKGFWFNNVWAYSTSVYRKEKHYYPNDSIQTSVFLINSIKRKVR